MTKRWRWAHKVYQSIKFKRKGKAHIIMKRLSEVKTIGTLVLLPEKDNLHNRTLCFSKQNFDCRKES